MKNHPAKAQITGSFAGVEYATCSDIGLKRTINQDAHEIRLAAEEDHWSDEGLLFIVADGMGAHVAGEYASRLAVEEVKNTSGQVEHKAELQDSFHRANSVIFEQGQSNPQFYNMGTTCSALWLLPVGALIGHVGDSRIYRQRENRIEQLTFDHSLVWEMQAAGQISPANQSVPRNVITRCLGPHPVVDVDLEGPFSVAPGDVFLLCSDGLTGRITDTELGTIVKHLPTRDATELLVDLANLRGGHDNITVTLVRIVGSKVASHGETVDTSLPSTGTNASLWLLAGLGLVISLIAIPLSKTALAVSGAALFLVAAIALLWQWLAILKNIARTELASPPYTEANTVLDDQVVTGIRNTLEDASSQLQEQSSLGETLIPALQSLDSTGDDPNSTLVRIREIARQLRSL